MEIRMASQFSSDVRGQKTMRNCLKNYKGTLFKIQNITQPNYGQMENFKTFLGIQTVKTFTSQEEENIFHQKKSTEKDSFLRKCSQCIAVSAGSCSQGLEPFQSHQAPLNIYIPRSLSEVLVRGLSQ